MLRTVVLLTCISAILTGCGLVEFGGGNGREVPSESYAMDREAPLSPRAEKTSVLGSTGEAEEIQPEPVERKRIYSGYAFLLVDSIEEDKKRIGSLAENAGGYIESSFESSVVIRVPAEEFDRVFKTLLTFGEVLQKSVETIDVTEAFQDLSTRLTIGQKTRERLYVLLEKTDDVEERLEILREIRRLTEEIERIGLRLTLLERQVSFSRISVDLAARLAYEGVTKDNIPFVWIADLNPLYGSLRRLRGRVSIDLGREFAVIPSIKVFSAESADGVRVRIGTTRNRPVGDASFWQKALNHHLNRLYKTAENTEVGPVRGVLFRSKDRIPFLYFAGVTVRGKNLGVVEVFFPSDEAYRSRWDSVRKGIEALQYR